MASMSSNPYRFFFPLGILYGILGVGYWVFWSVGWNVPGIGFSHATLQVQGFLANFVFGFLFTAFPRMTGTSPATKLEISVGVTASLGFLGWALLKDWEKAELAFLVIMADIIFFAARRLPHRKRNPPASFLLMGFGFLHALLGIALLWLSDFGAERFYLYETGRRMIQLGFLLCIVLGVTARLTPFLMGYGDDPQRENESNTSTVPHGLVGLGLLLSFLIEPWFVRAAWLLRAILTTAHFLHYARIARPLRNRNAVMFFFLISCWLIIIGHWGGVLWPAYRIAALHIIFIGGFSLMIFSFGTNVVLSHSAHVHKLQGKLIPMKIVGTLVLITLAGRIGADLWPERYPLLIHLSSGTWVLVALGWLIQLFPRFFDRPLTPS